MNKNTDDIFSLLIEILYWNQNKTIERKNWKQKHSKTKQRDGVKEKDLKK